LLDGKTTGTTSPSMTNRINPLDHLRQNPFVLAPMAGITDRAFRTFMREMGCSVVITELVSGHGIEYKSAKTLALMEFEEVQRPIGIQLFGETPEVLAKAAQVVEEYGADFVDLNFGCPVPKVVKKGAGSAILKDLNAVEAVFKAVKGATSLPVTVKIRTGWDEGTRNAEKVAEIAYNEGLTWVAIHGRTRAAAYSGWADWDYIAEVKAKSKIPILGNGDIASAEQAVDRIKQTGVDGVMIGRGCLKNPWIFRDANALWKQQRSLSESEKDFLDVFLRLHEGFKAYRDDRIKLIQLKKFASWYSSGYPGASQFRKNIFQITTLEETLKHTLDFFAGLTAIDQEDTSKEAFLMGGHG
jgi:tRNA-dihydrouridine synthase B